MSGHSKWRNIKIKKQKMDKLRGSTFTRATKEIITAAREGGENPDTNLRLKKAIEKAKEVNMPQDNIKRAVMRGAGKLEGVSYEEFTLEGYGPDGVAIMLEVLTDNKQRALPEVRHIFSKSGGSLGEGGCVSWMFKKNGIIVVDKNTVDEETLMDIALEAGAQDIQTEENSYEVITSPEDLERVKSKLLEKKINISSAEITFSPTTTVQLKGEKAQRILKLVEALDELDDVQNVYANFDIPEKEIEG